VRTPVCISCSLVLSTIDSERNSLCTFSNLRRSRSSKGTLHKKNPPANKEDRRRGSCQLLSILNNPVDTGRMHSHPSKSQVDRQFAHTACPPSAKTPRCSPRIPPSTHRFCNWARTSGICLTLCRQRSGARTFRRCCSESAGSWVCTPSRCFGQSIICNQASRTRICFPHLEIRFRSILRRRIGSVRTPRNISCKAF
jgi:hypothetical protein